jgi:hypothetical protein
MKHKSFYFSNELQKCAWLLTCMFFLSWAPARSAEKQQMYTDSLSYITCRGLVTDAASGLPLSFASVLVDSSNIATVTNSEGEFVLKIPRHLENGNLLVTFLGYRNKHLPIAAFSEGFNLFKLEVSEVKLPEIKVVFKDAESLMRAVFEKKKDNYVDKPTLMTAFYRETIKKRKSYVSLLESIVDVYKFPYTSARQDMPVLFKVRKKTDYEKLDTLIFKLMGGPYNTLYMDIMKNPDLIFTDKVFDRYHFGFDRSTMINNRLVYVVDFKQKQTEVDPLFYGKLYIDAETLALISAAFDMNLENMDLASQLFVQKKPLNAKVELTRANYRMNYLVRNGRWYLGYSRIELNVKIDWKRRLFNSNYESVMEMAVTDWAPAGDEKWAKATDRLKPNVVVTDAASGFVDPEFWGAQNVIEPEKSIQSAIRKIQKKLNGR